MKNKYIVALATAALLAVTTATVKAEDKHDHGTTKETVDGKSSKSAKAYPLDKCVVSDEKLDHDGKPYVFDYKGQEVKLCCKDCLKDFKKEPEKYIKKIEEAKAKEQAEKK
jgi:YHS domain-containing protein